jgi:hypothetical protein
VQRGREVGLFAHTAALDDLRHELHAAVIEAADEPEVLQQPRHRDAQPPPRLQAREVHEPGVRAAPEPAEQQHCADGDEVQRRVVPDGEDEELGEEAEDERGGAEEAVERAEKVVSVSNVHGRCWCLCLWQCAPPQSLLFCSRGLSAIKPAIAGAPNAHNSFF